MSIRSFSRARSSAPPPPLPYSGSPSNGSGVPSYFIPQICPRGHSQLRQNHPLQSLQTGIHFHLRLLVLFSHLAPAPVPLPWPLLPPLPFPSPHSRHLQSPPHRQHLIGLQLSASPSLVQRSRFPRPRYPKRPVMPLRGLQTRKALPDRCLRANKRNEVFLNRRLPRRPQR